MSAARRRRKAAERRNETARYIGRLVDTNRMTEAAAIAYFTRWSPK